MNDDDDGNEDDDFVGFSNIKALVNTNCRPQSRLLQVKYRK